MIKVDFLGVPRLGLEWTPRGRALLSLFRIGSFFDPFEDVIILSILVDRSPMPVLDHEC